ncbi:LytTR family DNA-binding domain-containing protein [Sphingomonas sp. LB-2]|uniref:LytR/AlgR family response regulator transcription factor n=1 Tax=Sphingomonas caeni TaxID=2984949 RepID=UPI00222ED7D3|nr:LytTR family DNA-binding domain-containing protein [Sphingomonas caeni]MCW3849511.1 LytTR family DNA-binding domain-containing protein [Sphingomonas caeni]
MKAASQSIRVLVVDDEAPARKRLRDLLSKDRDVSQLFEAKNGVEAVALIQGEHPDIVFLDVQMPGVDGFGVIDTLGAGNMPLTVFVTAYDQFALRAFEAEALDYLLKPFGDARYRTMMERVKKRLSELRADNAGDANAFGPELLKLAAARAKPGEIWNWMVVKKRDATQLVMTEDIDWIEAAGVYVTLHVEGQELLYRAGLATVAKRLDPFRFVRIHRSSLVNLRSVALLERRSHGEFEVVMKDGKRLTLSRSYRADVEAMLGQSL